MGAGVSGALTANEQAIAVGDGAAIQETDMLRIAAQEPSEFPFDFDMA